MAPIWSVWPPHAPPCPAWLEAASGCSGSIRCIQGSAGTHARSPPSRSMWCTAASSSLLCCTPARPPQPRRPYYSVPQHARHSLVVPTILYPSTPAAASSASLPLSSHAMRLAPPLHAPHTPRPASASAPSRSAPSPASTPRRRSARSRNSLGAAPSSGARGACESRVRGWGTGAQGIPAKLHPPVEPLKAVLIRVSNCGFKSKPPSPAAKAACGPRAVRPPRAGERRGATRRCRSLA